eukprot:CAMPEP_0172527318 /NCGR_PEP_ID=MMETSP1067-20121228/2040_1 /TAXON_ID=265564 ORGANISM="Thalassiosira punctigera, Strain Tpunct2005C2" /NCGR_SAMPLE_ID=MMETSP1067 /ASSEMBLY_ACC=CAM_ASM_000444 /LENGTH=176 /DNA_ID=CAMNT_0013311039 /DNA_START=303 /DNA_END=833 /DNA_ORIENTATION=-
MSITPHHIIIATHPSVRITLLLARERLVKHHQQFPGIVFHSPLHAGVNDVHRVHPLLLVLPRHANVSLVGDVVEGLLEEIEVHALSLLFSDEEIALFEAGGDGGDIHHREGATQLVRGGGDVGTGARGTSLVFGAVVDEGESLGFHNAVRLLGVGGRLVVVSAPHSLRLRSCYDVI